MCESSLTVSCSLAEIARAAGWLEAFAGTAGLPSETTARLHIVLDEVLSNVINHAATGNTPTGHPPTLRTIGLGLRSVAGLVELAISDDGAAFDPTGVRSVPPAKRIAERQQGGLGLLFVRALMDDVQYSRRDGRNHLVLRKRLS
jgi:anti-sigma regulatory factor (Ser/Thr protein kinase)